MKSVDSFAHMIIYATSTLELLQGIHALKLTFCISNTFKEF
jgi:hypothetical protein